MKSNRFLLAVAVVLVVAGCSGDVTSPDPSSLRAPGSVHEDAAPAETSAATTSPTAADPGEEDPGDNGSSGSGCCAIVPGGG